MQWVFICSPRADRPLPQLALLSALLLPGVQGAAEPCPQGRAHLLCWLWGPCHKPSGARRQNHNCGCPCITHP